MVQQFTKNIFSSTYRDRFTDSDAYYRVLFNSGRALQASELTELQSIIQGEIARIGRHLFKEGAAVNPGGVVVDQNYEFIKLNTTVNTLPVNPNDLVGVSLTSDSGVVVKVLEVVPAENSDPATLYVKYTDTSAVAAGAAVIRVAAGEDLNGSGYTLTVQSTNTVANPAVGRGTKVSVNAGDFWTQDHFVFGARQSKIISKYGRTPTTKVGFRVTQSIVTANDDQSLYDNTGPNPNLSAPGADRYRILLTIATQDEINSDENFVQVADIVNGQIAFQVTGTDDYNKIEERLALRTQEESGDYIVRPFLLKFDTDDSDSTILNFKVSPGVAYVDGYRAATTVETVIPVSKPRTTILENNDVSAVSYGSYVLVSGNKGLPNINSFELVNLRSAADYGGSTIGTARVRSIEEDGANYRVYLFQITMNSGQNFRDVASFGTGVTDYMNCIQVSSQTTLNDTLAQNNNLLYPLPYNRPQSISDISLTVQRRFTATTNGSGQATITLSALGEVFADTNQWILAGTDSDIFSATITGSGTTSATISSGPLSKNIEILAYVNKSAGNIRSKTLTTVTETLTPDSADVVTLSRTDIYEIEEIKDGTSGGADISTRYTVDNGQRDNFYGRGRLILRAGQSAPAGNVYVQYKHFAHGASGDFFAVNSYTGQVNYEDIPSHTLSNGTTVPLRDVLDFRSSVNTSGTFGAGAAINELPRNTDLVTYDANYYLSKAVNVVIDTGANVRAIQSDPSLTPTIPRTPDDALSLYTVRMNPYTLNDTDISSQLIEAKRYTMADIGILEKRINGLEELTSLSLLEIDTNTLDVLDSAGLNRTKSGIFVDNFVDQARSSITSPEYRAQIDTTNEVLTVPTIEDEIRLKYDSDAAETSGVIKKGDNVYLNYTQVSYINQAQASGTENVNPFNVVQNKGILRLSPASDNWVETRYASDLVIDGGTRLIADRSVDGVVNILRNSRGSGWFGIQTATQVATQFNENTLGGTDQATGWRNVATRGRNQVQLRQTVQTVREVVADRVLDRAFIPFMRSRKIYFEAQGLRPNTRYFPFFDGVNVSNWVRQESFQRISDIDETYGTSLRNATQHPDGPTTLITNSDGKVTGSFVVSSTDALRFRTGERSFVLINISQLNYDNATSSALSAFVATGVLETRQRTIRSTRQVTVSANRVTVRRGPVGRDGSVDPADGGRGQDGPGVDPLAQSFFVKESSGIFLTKVDLRFATKSTDTPVFIQIRPLVNGSPSSNEFIPGSEVFLPPSSVNVSNDASAITSFEFDEPIYLTGQTEYAIVVLSDSNEYNAYVAEVGEFVLNSTEARITKQTSMGSLFKSQNGTTWEPDQTKDLSFTLHRANFTTSPGTAIIENINVPVDGLIANPITTTSSSATVRVYHPNHGFTVGDTVTIAGAVATGGISAANINGNRTITALDGLGYEFTAGGTASSSVIGGGSAVTATRNITFDYIFPYFEVLNPVGTLLDYSAKFTTAQSLAGTETAYVKDGSYRILGNREEFYFNAPHMIANTANETANLGAGVRSVTFKVNMSTSNSFVSPVLDMQRASLVAYRNRIDKQIAAPSAGFNVPLTYVAETDPINGTHLAKHLTRPITLAQKARGLKLFIAANRPSVSDFQVYYKTNGATTEDDITNIPWVLVNPESTPPSDEVKDVYREYEYLIGGLNGTLPDFDRFQIKIVFRSSNSSKVPTIRDLRTIALSV